MGQSLQIISTSIKVAFQELRVNKLRTLLSLLGVSIGIFCIVAVSTVLDSLENNIKNSMASLGSDVVYISKWPWMDEDGEYKWWEFNKREVQTIRELELIERRSQTAQYATLMYSRQVNIFKNALEASNISASFVTTHFEKMQDFEIREGRYFNDAELAAGGKRILLGHEVAEAVFPTAGSPVGEFVTMEGNKFQVIGILKKAGSNMAGFNFDKSVILPFVTAAGLYDVGNKHADVLLMVKARQGIPIDELSAEMEGLLRAERQIRPGEKNDFSINQLSQVTERISSVFVMIDLVGLIIAFFSLLVGGFGIANIMFVSVRERTKIIGLKKAVGARPGAILTEFLIEAITLCLLGGLAGIFIVLILSVLVSQLVDFPVILSWQNFLIGIIVSSGVGLLAGYIPARSAARLDPVTAIRAT